MQETSSASSAATAVSAEEGKQSGGDVAGGGIRGGRSSGADPLATSMSGGNAVSLRFLSRYVTLNPRRVDVQAAGSQNPLGDDSTVYREEEKSSAIHVSPARRDSTVDFTVDDDE